MHTKSENLNLHIYIYIYIYIYMITLQCMLIIYSMVVYKIDLIIFDL